MAPPRAPQGVGTAVAVLTVDQIRTLAATDSLVVSGVVAPNLLYVVENVVDRLTTEAPLPDGPVGPS